MDNITHALKNQVKTELELCTECKKCLRVCPIPLSDKIDIKELNRATLDSKDSSEKITSFAFDCFGCGACVPVCPEELRRDRMMVHLRSKKELPKGYNNLLHWRGKDLPFHENIAVSLLRI